MRRYRGKRGTPRNGHHTKKRTSMQGDSRKVMEGRKRRSEQQEKNIRHDDEETDDEPEE